MTNAYVRESQRLYRVLGIIKGAERGKMNSMHGCGLQNRQGHPLQASIVEPYTGWDSQ